MPVAGADTYVAKNQDVKTDPKDFYQSPFFNIVFHIVLGISVGGKGSTFIKICLRVLMCYEKKNQNNTWSSLPYLSSSFVMVGKRNTILTHESLSLTTQNQSAASPHHLLCFHYHRVMKSLLILFKMKRNNFQPTT